MSADRDLWNVVGWALVLGALTLVGVGLVLAFVAWPVHTGGAGLFAGWFALGWWGGRRAQADELATARAAHDMANGSAARDDLADVGSMTDQINAERALAVAVLEVWGLGDPDPTQVTVAHDMAASLLTSLVAQRCRVLTPSSRLPGAPTDGDPEEMFVHLWPGVG